MARLSLIAAFALSACVADADDTTVVQNFSEMEWQLAEVDGKAPGWSATINLGEVGQINGQAPCNRFFGPVTWQGDSFVPGQIAATEMACEHLNGETEFFALLAAVTHAEQMPGVLVLKGGGHQMRFVQPIN